MSFFRSEPMTLCQMVLHHESAFDCLIELGYLAKVQFRDIHTAEPNNQYLPEIRRCHELSRMINHLQTEMIDFNIKITIYPDVDKDEIPRVGDLKDLEAIIEQTFAEATSVELNIEGLRKQRNSLSEKIKVLQMADHFLMAKSRKETMLTWSDSVTMQLIHNDLRPLSKEQKHLAYLTGTIPLEKFQAFELMLWRVSAGNFYITQNEIEFDEREVARKSFTVVKKCVFIIFFLGLKMRDKIAKVCQGFRVKLFECPESKNERQAEIAQISETLENLNQISNLSHSHRFRTLLIAAADLYIWKVKVKKILMAYTMLNRMGQVQHLQMSKYLQAECWIPTKDISAVRLALARGVRHSSKGNPRSMFIPILNLLQKQTLTDSDKPTHFSLNSFTKGFQHLIDAYGTAEYGELNPAPYTIITFPFLFAVMFGDMGHGLLMLVFGLWMLTYERSLEEKQRLSTSSSEIWNILFAGRYIISLMGAFSVYTGIIYNDCFSKAINIFGSAWQVSYNQSTVISTHELQLDPARIEHFRGTPYEVGFDPIWNASGENAIITSNSFKMKLAIIFGVLQMMFGLILSAFNFVHKRDFIDLLLIFLPQFTFFGCLFAYLVFLIFFKWVNFGGHNASPYNSACAPSILIMFINMLLMKDAETTAAGCEVWMFEYQATIQTTLLAIALICIPVLLAGKPVWFILQRYRIRKIKNEALRRFRTRNTISNIRKSLIYNIEAASHFFAALNSHKGLEMEKQDVGELWIHSGIHCIESILGAVSHTASYLRLWALSLAHDQLSTVLWNMVLRIGLTGQHGYWNSLILSLMFVIWAILTVAILVVMEGLSAFLHTLRLHWVEFQSKFYTGSGERFAPFQFPESTALG